jgi:hypothetical protein
MPQLAWNHFHPPSRSLKGSAGGASGIVPGRLRQDLTSACFPQGCAERVLYRFLSYKHFYPGAQGKAGRKGRKPGENSGKAANCRAEIGFRAAESPAIRCLPRVSRWPAEIAQLLGQTLIGRTPCRHPDGFPMTLGIIGESGYGRPAERGVRKDPSLCSARFPDGAGCGRRRVGR